MDETGFIFLYVVVWIGIVACLLGLVIWWGAFKIPENHVGLSREEKIYSAGWHFHSLGRFMRVVLVDLPSLEKKVSGEVTSSIKNQLLSIESTAKQMGFSFEVDIKTQIRKFIQNNKQELLLGTAEMQTLTNEVKRIADGELKSLQLANEAYQKAVAEYEVTSAEVHRSGSGSLIRQLDKAHDGLFSPNLEQLLNKRMWSEFGEMMKGAVAHFRDLKSLANQVQRQDSANPQYEVRLVKTNEQKAYEILGVPPAITRDEMKKVLRHLRQAYHPDNSTNPEKRKALEAKLQQLEWAANILGFGKSVTQPID